MRERTTRMIVTAVLVVALVMGVPGSILAGVLVWNNEYNVLEARAQTLARAVDRRIEDDYWVTHSTVTAWTKPVGGSEEAYTVVKIPGRYVVVAGTPRKWPVMSTRFRTTSGVVIEMQISALGAIRAVVLSSSVFAIGVLLSVGVGWVLARQMARKLSSPLIYLAAHAEQIGSGHVRARIKPSGIEEIDLVQEELVRTGERMAGRLAAERQRSADASHQLRTPLAALSMRLEEIELIAEDKEVKAEAQVCLEQVERMTTVVTELLDDSRRTGGSTEALHILEVFNTQREEWEDQFRHEGRQLVFIDAAERPVLAESGKLAQVLATLIENSLHYGAGTTTVQAHKSSSSRGVVIEVTDEGSGIDEDLAEDIFEMGVSGHGSSGIGLALARDLTQSMGGRLELSKLHPPVFTLSLAAIPTNFDPDVVMPQGPLVSMGRRSRHL